MKKKLCLAVLVFAVMALFFKGIPSVAAAVAAHGILGANYGAVGFPILLGAAALYLYRRQE